MRRGLSDVTFGLLVTAALALAVLAVLVMTGRFVAGPSDVASPKVSTASSPTKRPAPPPAKRVTPTQAASIQPSQAPVHITITANRGDCWIMARRGSQTGPILVQELLPRGREITLRGPHIWLELGAAANVDIAVNGQARTVPAGTTSMLLG